MEHGLQGEEAQRLSEVLREKAGDDEEEYNLRCDLWARTAEVGQGKERSSRKGIKETTLGWMSSLAWPRIPLIRSLLIGICPRDPWASSSYFT